MLSSDLQSLKAYSPIVVTVSGITIEVKPLLAKALPPISVTLSGIVNFVIFLQSLKASSPMRFTFSG